MRRVLGLLSLRRHSGGVIGMAKGIMYIDGQRVPFDGEPNVLSVIRKTGIEMPTFCYYSDLSVYGACRMCVVEDERGKIETSCSMQPRDGLSIKTNTARLLKHRRMILELMLASHNCSCTTCEKSGDCHLQALAVISRTFAVLRASRKPSTRLRTRKSAWRLQAVLRTQRLC